MTKEFEEFKKKQQKNTETMTKAEKIADIMGILMKLAGEPEEAILAMQVKCLKEGAEA